MTGKLFPLISLGATLLVEVGFGIVSIVEARKTRKALCEQVHNDLLSEETKMTKEALEIAEDSRNVVKQILKNKEELNYD